MRYDLGELERIIAAMMRIGTISALDETHARVQVKSGEITTDWIPWGTPRAGNTRIWSAPRVGEQVLLFCPGGDPSQAIVGPSIYQTAFSAPANSKDKETTVFPDGTTFEYDSAANTYTQTVAGNGNWVFNCKHATVNATEDATVNTKAATVNASTSTTLNTPTTHCTGDLHVDGSATIGGSATVSGSTSVQAITSHGKDISDGHKHSGVQSGGSISGPVV
jgi:phage baseplate assembly protein V